MSDHLGPPTRESILAETLRLHDLRYGTDHCDRKYVQVCSRFQELLFNAAPWTPAAPDQTQYVITSLSIDGVVPTIGQLHPERTPIGPFPSREAAWEYAQQMQLRHGNGGGSVDVAPLIAPRQEATPPPPPPRRTPLPDPVVPSP